MVTTDTTRWVLIAEDDDQIRQMLTESVQVEGESLNVKVVEARDGLEAISQAATRRFHCVITDLNMPRSNGEDFIRTIQSQPLNANTPTLVVSGYARQEFKEFCERFDHIKVIPKPFEPWEVAQAAIREIKLGPIDDRVSVHLLNPFLNAIQKFFAEELKTVAEPISPLVKKAGEQISGDIHCMLTLSTSVTKARFCLSFDKTLLDWARVNYVAPRMPPGTGAASEGVPRFLVMALLERAAVELQTRMGGVPRLSGLSILNSNSRVESETAELIKSRGVIVACRTEAGRIFAGAYSRAKTKAA